MTPQRAKELLPIISAYANGEPIQYRKDTHSEWRDSLGGLGFEAQGCQYRIKPKPVTRPWSKPEDVPGPVCWLRNGPTDCYPVMALGFNERGISLTRLEGGRNFVLWNELSSWEHSTDRKTWHPCTVTEEPA